ncbi:restriction endonuclease [Babesia ovata]|uniref:Restriction endonuclease n=1 Tax=Babesia ovata TaxID=189622 RepID=A0A2H6KAK3_9APIC|nr:restriction endonuclease [Babesia ovata]GBE60023.1 restriction endonuclease [Babesia ovata]
MDRYQKRSQKKSSGVASAVQGQGTPVEGSAELVAFSGSSAPGSGDVAETKRNPRNRGYGKSSFAEGRDRPFYRGSRIGTATTPLALGRWWRVTFSPSARTCNLASIPTLKWWSPANPS